MYLLFYDRQIMIRRKADVKCSNPQLQKIADRIAENRLESFPCLLFLLM